MAESGAFGQSRRISESAIKAVQDHALYQQLLGITAPWRVRQVELNRKEGEVLIQLDTDDTAIAVCPTCGAPSPIHDHREPPCVTVPVASIQPETAGGLR